MNNLFIINAAQRSLHAQVHLAKYRLQLKTIIDKI